LSVGFYYRTFYKPNWNIWEPSIRKFAGLGVVRPAARPPISREPEYRHVDVLVVGGGMAGLEAARAAAAQAQRVMLVEKHQLLGGEGLLNGDAEFSWIADEAKALRDAGVEVLTSTVASGLYADNWMTVLTPECLVRVRARKIVLATGADEQMAVFRNNERPGIMLSSAVSRLAMAYGVVPGRRAVIVTSTEDGYRLALLLYGAGVEVASLVDLSKTPSAGPQTLEAVRAARIDMLLGYAPIDSSCGPDGRVCALKVAPTGSGGAQAAMQGRVIQCDFVAVAVERLPNLALFAQAGGQVRLDPLAGELTVKHWPAGIDLAGAVGMGMSAGDHTTSSIMPRIFPHPKGKDFVDLDEDLTVGDLQDAVAEGYDHMELTKRYSTVGMGPSQGKHSALLSLAVVAGETGVPADGMAFTTVRPPFMPETMEILSGPRHELFRLTPMHAMHMAAGAQMVGATHWLRPTHYGAADDRLTCVEKEAAHVRNHAGIIDVSTLGKILFRGPDAAEFLERVYTGRFKNLKIGQIRYALMTDESGVVIDDGVVVRIGENEFFGTSTTSAVSAVFRRMKWWNTQWRLRVDLTNVTSQGAAINLAGPRSRDVLSKICADIDLSQENFSYMECRIGTIAGVPVKALRIGYVGELGYELHFPSGYGEHVWKALLDAGTDVPVKPFGTDAQRLLRLEKGHFIVGRDSDGLSNPFELGLKGLVAKSKPFFVGKRSLDIHLRRGIQRQMIGVTFGKGRIDKLAEGAIVVRNGDVVGRLTSVAYSPTLDTTIGLALVENPALPGSALEFLSSGCVWKGTHVLFPFYDPNHERQSL
jgi:sarcosine oxidase subunit alpha